MATLKTWPSRNLVVLVFDSGSGNFNQFVWTAGKIEPIMVLQKDEKLSETGLVSGFKIFSLFPISLHDL